MIYGSDYGSTSSELLLRSEVSDLYFNQFQLSFYGDPETVNVAFYDYGGATLLDSYNNVSSDQLINLTSPLTLGRVLITASSGEFYVTQIQLNDDPGPPSWHDVMGSEYWTTIKGTYEWNPTDSYDSVNNEVELGGIGFSSSYQGPTYVRVEFTGVSTINLSVTLESMFEGVQNTYDTAYESNKTLPIDAVDNQDVSRNIYMSASGPFTVTGLDVYPEPGGALPT